MRFLLAAAIIATYIVFTVGDPARASAQGGACSRSRRRAASGQSQRAPMLIAYASQTGYAEQIAKQTAQALQAANIPSRVRALADLSVEELSGTERALFVVSTYGEGDPPDTGLPFVHSVMSHSPALSRLAYGVLALGDRTYRNFCGFGKTLDGWLRRQCAVPMFDLVEVDNADEAALLHWQRAAVGTRWAAPPDAPRLDQGPRNERWQIAGRKLLNPGSAGTSMLPHRAEADGPGAKMHWAAGDIAVLTPPRHERARVLDRLDAKRRVASHPRAPVASRGRHARCREWMAHRARGDWQRDSVAHSGEQQLPFAGRCAPDHSHRQRHRHRGTTKPPEGA